MIKTNYFLLKMFVACATMFPLNTTVFAQQGIPPVPVDPDIRIGKLENGLTYYIRHNQEPKERASFYIIQNVGAILEEDDQNGLAHFLEHMAFNGTTNFPGKGIINTLQRYGVAFGRNINAYTAQSETVYNLSDVPSTNEGLIDTCLLVLHDWSDFLLLTDEEIELERGVISEEWRTRRNAAFRMQKKLYPAIFKGSKYADRDVIGDLEVIKTFDPETLRKFYKEWYRTDLQAIAVVGDVNVDMIERKIKDRFSSIPAEKNPPERSFYELPEHGETLFAVATDPESTSFGVNILIKHKGATPQEKNLGYYRDQMIRNLFNRIMSDRISELLQKGQPPFIAGNISYRKFVRGYDMMGISVNAHPNRMAEGLRALYTEARRVYLYGITETELERAKSNMLTQTENLWKQKDKIKNDQYLDAITDHFLENETLESIDFQWNATQQLLPTISAADLSAKAKKWIVPENRVITVMGPDGLDVTLLGEAEALAILKEVDESDIAPYEDAVVATSLIEKELKGSPIVKTEQMPLLNAVKWTLANNATVIFRFADFQKDNVLFQGISPGGNSLFEIDMLPSAMILSDFVGNFGTGSFDATTLKKMLSGKNVNLNPNLGELTEVFAGSSSPRDFETLLQLLYLKFEEPRFDQEAYDALKSRYVAMIANMNKNPQKVMSDSLQLILSGHHPRTILLSPEFFEKISLEQMKQIYLDRYSDAGDFTFFIVGNLEENVVKPLVEKYIGSLTDQPRSETWKNHQIELPKGKTSREIFIPLQTEKANVMVVMGKDAEWSPESNLKLSVVRDVLKLRYTEEIREKEGGTYSVSVVAQSEKFPESEKILQVNFDTDPEKADRLKSIVFREIDKLVKNGPTAEDLDKVVKNLLKDREQAKPNNGYWMGTLTNFYRYGVNFDLPGNYEDILKNLTVKDMKKFAGKFFKKTDQVEVVFKPLK